MRERRLSFGAEIGLTPTNGDITIRDTLKHTTVLISVSGHSVAPVTGWRTVPTLQTSQDQHITEGCKGRRHGDGVARLAGAHSFLPFPPWSRQTAASVVS